ncbi:MAG: NAD(P)/FAD-dependent oxidoreductase [Desulfatiglandales bacterium]
MTNLPTFDVLVVGGGPGGAVAAKRCAEQGLNTLLVEKKRLPRDKVCSGMVMGMWARQIIQEEFGPVPDFVLTTPPALSGQRFYVGRAQPRDLKWPTMLAWRRDLDFWMVQGAVSSGVGLRDGVRVAAIKPVKDGCRVALRKRGETETLHTRFVIGADGAASGVRKSMFPELKVRYSRPIRECYRGALDLEKNLIHWFFPKNSPRPRFNVNFKDDVFLIEGDGLRMLHDEIGETLSPYGFHAENTPEWKDGCVIAHLHDDLISGNFKPARSNALLVGDAAGLILPITFEGIGSALRSGILAAHAVIDHFDDGTKVASSYLKSLGPIVDVIRRLCIVQSNLKSAPHGDADFLARSLADAYQETLTIQESRS